MTKTIYQHAEFQRRLQPIAKHWLYCDECGDTGQPEPGRQVRYIIGVNMREVQLCLKCALALHDEAEAKQTKTELLLLARY